MITTRTIHSFNQVRATLRQMARMIAEAKVVPEFVNLARSIVSQAGAYGPEAEAEAVRLWVKGNIEFRLDPDGVEYLQAPAFTLACRFGDCDCQAALAGALLAAIGHPIHPLGAVWRGGEDAEHAVIFDELAGIVVDPVADVSGADWPQAPYILERFVTC
jgi:hypothetical protein